MCKNCTNSVHKQESGGWYRLVCGNDINGTGVNGFHKCQKFIKKESVKDVRV